MGESVQHIDSLGAFWLPGTSPDTTLSGRLTFDPSDGGRLHLVGGFDQQSESLFADPEFDPKFIYGVIDSGEVTLANCFSQGGARRYPGVTESKFYVNQIFLNSHIDPNEVTFDATYIRTSGADEWIGERVIDNRRTETAEAHIDVDWLNYVAPPEQTSKFSRGEVVLRYAWESTGGGSVRSVSFEHWPVFELNYPTPVAFDKLNVDAARIADLISLCMDEVTTTESQSFFRSDIRARMLSGEDGPQQEIKFLAPQLSYPQFKNRDRRHPHQMLLTFDELGGLPTVSRWLDSCPKFTRALASMMSIKRTERIFAENRFLNVAFAAEAFHRDLFGGTYMSQVVHQQIVGDCLDVVPDEHREWLKARLMFTNSLSLRHRLLQLVDKADGAVGPLIGDSRRWAGVVTDVRNHLTHLDSTKLNFSGSDLFYLSESVYSVVRICMLAEAGVPLTTLTAKAQSESMTWYRGRLTESVDRLRRQIRKPAPLA